MAKKVSELRKELDITLQELKKTADTMGIEIKSAQSSVDDPDAKRIIDTITKLKGTGNSPSQSGNKPKIKAVPIINKDIAPVHKAPEAEKVVPEETVEEPVVPAEKKSAKPAKAEKAEKVEKAEKPEKSEKPAKKEATVKEEKAEPAKKTPEKKKETVKKEDKPVKEAESDKKPEKKTEKKEEYVNAPNKPMRFKKIFDVAKEGRKANASGGKKDEKGGHSRGGRPERGEKSERSNRSEHSERSSRTQRDGQHRNHESGDDNRNQRHSSNTTQRRPAAGSTGGSGEEAKTASKNGKSKKFFGKDKEKDKEKRRYDHNGKSDNGKSGSNYFDERSLEKQTRHKRKNRPKPVEPEVEIEELLPEGTIAVTVPITVAGLSEQAEISASKLIMSLMKLGIMATINQSLDKDTVEMLAEDLGMQVVVTEEQEEIEEPGLDTHEDTESELKPRAPIITVMGHVDHGKTSLLDAIRKTNVTASESGGITQHIGASEVTIKGKKIVFLDTPGHEAFTTMRARGAQVTDIAVLVVAADDSVKPQTIESISHAKAANVPIIVAINKMDKPGANPDKVKKDLADNGVLVEDWGGSVISVPISAKKGEGIKELLEMILLEAEMLELRANPDRLALGTVIEARLDKAKGPIATLLVTNGTLKTGQSVVAGTTSGKIRVMTSSKGDVIRKALPATPVEILGLSDVPMAGDTFNAVKDDKVAREIAGNRKEKMREEVMARNSSTTLEKLFSQIQEGETKELNLIIKGDVQGSVGAIISSLEKLDTDDVKVKIIHSGVGTVTESDVMLAETSNAIIIGFNVRPTTAVTNQAAEADVEIRLYRVIYDIIDDMQNAMKGMLDPEYREEVLGKATIRETFKVPNVGIIGGAYVTEGKVQRNMQIRLVRDGIVIHEGTISSLRRFKDDVKEVASNYECGIGIENYNDIKPEDVIECFTMVEIEK